MKILYYCVRTTKGVSNEDLYTRVIYHLCLIHIPFEISLNSTFWLKYILNNNVYAI